MNNFHEVPQITKEEIDDLYIDNGKDELEETGFEHEFEDEINEETARLNEYELREDEPYAERMGEKKQVYRLYNKAHGSQGDESLGKVGAYSDAQALEEGYRKGFNMSENTFVVGTGEFYIPRKKKKTK